jgi:hypothetical protein
MIDLYSGSTDEDRVACVNYLEDHLTWPTQSPTSRSEERYATHTTQQDLAATTKDMRDIARDSHRLGLNRQMTPRSSSLLDPRGTHIISPKFYR